MERRTHRGTLSAEQIGLDEGELRRRLGEDFKSTLERHSAAKAALLQSANVKYSLSDCHLSQTGEVSRIGDVEIKSSALAKCLSGYESCAVLALTLGVGADVSIRRCEAKSQTLGFVADALASVIADSACYEITNMLFGDEKHSPPFAVGYADSDTDSIPRLLKIADPTGSLGISVTDSHLMIPTKSIVVIVGKM